MKCDNREIIKKIPIVYFLIAAGFIATNFISYHNLEIYPGYSSWFIFVPLLLLCLVFLYFYKNGKYFEYDGSGEVLVFVNRGTFLSNFVLYREVKAEFPKQKLKSVEISDYFFVKILKIRIGSSEERTKKISFNITFLNLKKQKLILKSLSELIEQNKETA